MLQHDPASSGSLQVVFFLYTSTRAMCGMGGGALQYLSEKQVVIVLSRYIII